MVMDPGLGTSSSYSNIVYNNILAINWIHQQDILGPSLQYFFPNTKHTDHYNNLWNMMKHLAMLHGRHVENHCPKFCRNQTIIPFHPVAEAGLHSRSVPACSVLAQTHTWRGVNAVLTNGIHTLAIWASDKCRITGLSICVLSEVEDEVCVLFSKWVTT